MSKFLGVIIFSVFFLFLFFAFYVLDSNKIFADTTTLSVTVRIPGVPYCGDDSCNGSETCSSCSADCGPCPAGGGGGISISPYTEMIFQGKTYPQTFVYLLKDGQIAAKTLSGINGDFEIKLTAIYHGTYIFSLLGEDKQGRNSGLYAFSINVVYGATTVASGILIGPTVSLDKEEVEREKIIFVSGQSIPGAEIALIVSGVESGKEISFKTKADEKGEYSYKLDVSEMEFGEYVIKTKAAGDGYVSNFSRVLDFIIGEKVVFAEAPKKWPVKADFNGDGRVNLVDFSILLYWFNKSNPPEKIDLNSDGVVDITDFSIMAYYWTG
jgi:hypothetical protein